MTAEQWKPIERWPGYEVSDRGQIRSWKKSRQSPSDALPRLLSSYPLGIGYRCVTLKDKGRRKGVYIHREVLTAFVGPCPPGLECCHKDGKPWNNCVSNLRWDTRQANIEDQQRHGTRVRGERCHNSVLTRRRALAMRAFEGSHREAATAFGVRYHVAYCVRTRRSWRHV